MPYSRSVIAIVQERSSHRSYTPQPVEAAKLRTIETFCAGVAGPFGGRVRFVILDTTGWGGGKINALGTYGTIQGATLFVAGIIRRGAHDMEDFGYQFEQALLQATDLGLATCWIGGVFNRSRFADRAGVGADEVLPAVSPLGYAAPRRSVADSIIRWSAGSTRRRPWSDLFFHGSFATPLDPRAAGPYSQPLEMLRLAPSASNRQPWRVLKDPGRDVFHLCLCRSRGYDKLIKAVDLQRIDIGIAMSHFELTARELGLEGRWAELPPAVSLLPDRTEYIQSWVASSLRFSPLSLTAEPEPANGAAMQAVQGDIDAAPGQGTRPTRL